MKINLKFLVIAVSLGLMLLSIGCTKQIVVDDGRVVPETRNLSLEKPAPIPPGVVRFCWEEPIVQYEPNGPGVTADGYWYQPSFIAVRQVRQGRWRPCAPVPSEIKGEIRNER